MKLRTVDYVDEISKLTVFARNPSCIGAALHTREIYGFRYSLGQFFSEDPQTRPLN
jgi:hypothetical protein